MDEENLKDAIAKAAEKNIEATATPDDSGYARIGNVNYPSFGRYIRIHTACFLWDVLKAFANSEMAATPDGIKAMAEVATAIGQCSQ